MPKGASVGDADGAKVYDDRVAAGRLAIIQHWGRLLARTQAALAASGAFSGSGTAAEASPLGGRQDGEHMVWAIGVLLACAGAALPSREDRHADIPWQALTDDVGTACTHLLNDPRGRDPQFIRWAIAAIVRQQQAETLRGLGPSPKFRAHGCVTMLFRTAWIVASPAAVAWALVAASNGEFWSTVFAAYAAAIGIGCAFDMKKPAHLAGSAGERAHHAWLAFAQRHPSPAIGTSARRHLEKMEADGMVVPAVLFDLCAALEMQAAGEANAAAFAGT